MRLFFLPALVLVVSCHQKNPDVPSVVINTLQQRFAYTKDVEWKLNGQTYVAAFEKNHIDYEVQIDATGRLLLLHQNVHPDSLPPPVKLAIRTQYGNAKIEGAIKIEKGDTFFYCIKFDSKHDQRITFRENGDVDTSISW